MAMNPQGFRKFFTLFTLLLFLGSKALSYHSMAHSSDEEQMQCDLCELVILQDITPAVEVPITEISVASQSFIPVTSNYSEPYLEAISYGPIFSRPPPTTA